MIALAYVMHLRKTDLSLEQIRTLVNDTNIEDSYQVLCEQVAYLQDQIAYLKKVKKIVSQYAECFRYGIEHHGKVKLIDGLTVILNSSDEAMVAEQSEYAWISQKYKFHFSFIGKMELFLRDRIEDQMEIIPHLTYAVSAVFPVEERYDPQDFLADGYTIISPRQYVFAVIKCHIPYDYEEFNLILAYIKGNKLNIDGDVLIRSLSLRNGPERNIDYYEVYIPVST